MKRLALLALLSTQFVFGGAVHVYWRVNVANVNDTGVGGHAVSVTELAFRSAAGGSNLATGGTGISNNTNTGCCPIANAFDGNTATLWGSNFVTYTVSGFNSPLPYIGYQFAAAKAIVEFAWTSRNDSFFAAQNPIAMSLDWSDDNSSWTATCSFTVPANGSPGAWTTGETKTFDCASNAVGVRHHVSMP